MKAAFDRIVLLVAALGLALDGLALADFLLHPLAGDHIFHSPFYRATVILLLVPLTLLVGFLVIRRVPGNTVGPLFIVWSGTVAFWSIREQIAPALFAFYAYYDMAFGWLGLFLMLMHFPDGRIQPPGAAPWLYRMLGVFFCLISLNFLSTANFSGTSGMVNPFYQPTLEQGAGWILGLALLVFTPILALALVSPALRYRQGSFQVRQQIKWLALFASFNILYVLLILIAYPLLTGNEIMNPGNRAPGMVFYLITSLFPPLAIGVAVLRHRLWDIDILIRRTLVYSILTASLAVVFFTSVVILQTLFAALIGRQSSAAVVLSTLAIAALFTPLRRRIQTSIDRRFYRQKYNAERVLADFGTMLREKGDLDQLTNSILGVMEKTMQPEIVSLWLRKVDHLTKARGAEERT